MSKKPFNDAFAKLKERAPKAPPPASRPPDDPLTPSVGPRSGPQPRGAPAPPPPPRERTADELWAEATSGVRRVDPGHGVAAPPPPPSAPDGYWHPDFEAIDALRALVSGDAPFDLADSDEFIEGKVTGLDPQVLRKLRRGEYAVQGHLDLHGMTREEAKTTVEGFLRAARAGGKRCVLLVHGRGIHSKDQLPVLKDALRTWLATARFGRHVLAFATARPADGGAGALYVLLRRAGR